MPGTPGTPIDFSGCACCSTVACASNPERIPKSLGVEAAYDGNVQHFTLVWDDDLALWIWNGNLAFCGNLSIRGMSLECTGTLGEFLITVSLFAVDLEEFNTIGGLIDYFILDTEPFLLVFSVDTTGIGISGCTPDLSLSGAIAA